VRVTGQTGVAGKIRRETNERRLDRIPSGRRTQGCPWLGRLARTSSDIAEMKEEHHGRFGKVREDRNEKVNIIKIDSIVDIPLNRSWPFIFIGWEVLPRKEILLQA
jgi:hypothetical protein